jgi:hypothetical protein
MIGSAGFDFARFIDVVFAIETGETVLVLTDEPDGPFADNRDWRDRRVLAADWLRRLATLGGQRGFNVLPLLRFPATGADNGFFPPRGWLGNDDVELAGALGRVTLAIAMTEFSMTAALMQEALRRPGAHQFRAASMPLARRDMEANCLDIDYARLRRRCQTLQSLFARSETLEVEFTTGHRCRFDLRHRQSHVDDGYLHRDKEGPPLINLPSGEVWIVPYEGEHFGDHSSTAGVIPVAAPGGSIAEFVVEGNRVVAVEGADPARQHFRAIFEVDPVRRNVSEVSFGCNDRARVSGLFIEDEKAGFHWGFGRSDFLGGTVKAEHFRDASTVVHHDIPYARGCPITASATLIERNASRIPVLDQGRYLSW